ncbi:hypothetical protein SDC9_143072 [bioreactor metagenome]|uniref:Uncharacterized protein n=1 Tax=bioreactor metagenome TaxID=1076179 RepID=A0A645E2X1_9ZZZZ
MAPRVSGGSLGKRVYRTERTGSRHDGLGNNGIGVSR